MSSRMLDNLWNAWSRLMQPHIVKWNSPHQTAEISSVTIMGCYVNTHFGRLGVIEIVPYTHILVLEKYRHASLIYL
jgi:hypothetical protein